MMKLNDMNIAEKHPTNIHKQTQTHSNALSL